MQSQHPSHISSSPHLSSGNASPSVEMTTEPMIKLETTEHSKVAALEKMQPSLSNKNTAMAGGIADRRKKVQRRNGDDRIKSGMELPPHGKSEKSISDNDDDAESDKRAHRGKYRCGRCGQPKVQYVIFSHSAEIL